MQYVTGWHFVSLWDNEFFWSSSVTECSGESRTQFHGTMRRSMVDQLTSQACLTNSVQQILFSKFYLTGHTSIRPLLFSQPLFGWALTNLYSVGLYSTRPLFKCLHMPVFSCIFGVTILSYRNMLFMFLRLRIFFKFGWPMVVPVLSNPCLICLRSSQVVQAWSFKLEKFLIFLLAITFLCCKHTCSLMSLMLRCFSLSWQGPTVLSLQQTFLFARNRM